MLGEPVGAIGGAGVAAAIPADFPAIRDMDVKRERLVDGDGRQADALMRLADAVVELGGGWVAGVSRNGLCQQVGMISPHAFALRRRALGDIDMDHRNRRAAR